MKGSPPATEFININLKSAFVVACAMSWKKAPTVSQHSLEIKETSKANAMSILSSHVVCKRVRGFLFPFTGKYSDIMGALCPSIVFWRCEGVEGREREFTVANKIGYGFGNQFMIRFRVFFGQRNASKCIQFFYFIFFFQR